jgi:hypothetical protein
MQFPKHRIRKVMEFGEKIDGFPLLRRIIGDMVYDHWPQGSRQVFKMEYSDIRQSEPPEYHFAVSAFGLPEIDSTLKQPTPVWLWFIALAAGTCILAIVFKWLGRQRASS